MSTIFHKIINKEIPANIVYENDQIIAFRDVAPVARVHILIVPKKSLSSCNEISDDDAGLIGEMICIASKIAKVEGIDGDGYRLVMNCGQDGGQTVQQLHLHLIGGRAMAWPPG